MPEMLTFEGRIARSKFRAWHRGTREADYMIGGFFDRYHADWTSEDLAWFEALLEQDDVDIIAWALGTKPTPKVFQGPLIERMQALDYVDIPR